MSTMTTIKVTGLRELERKLGPQLIAQPMRNFWSRSTGAIVENAKPLAPFDRGELRNTITDDMDTAYLPRWARAGIIGGSGALKTYAAAQEFGTRPFWPPEAPIAAWVQRKRISMVDKKTGKELSLKAKTFLIRRAISKKGIEKKEYLDRGTKAALPAIRGYVSVLAAEIEAQAGK